MHTLLRGARAIGAVLGVTALLQGIGLAAGPTADATTVMSATAGVNVRAAASTSSAVLGVLRTGTTVTAVSSSNGWTQVTYNGRTAYVYSAYLTTVATTTTVAAPAISSTSPTAVATTATTTEVVNVRTGPGIQYPVTAVLPKARSIAITATTSNGYTQLTDGRWISTAWITAPSPTTTTLTTPSTATPTPTPTPTPPPAPTPLPAVTGQVRATAALMIRTTSGADYTSLGDVPAGTILDITGVTTDGMAQIVYNGAVRWVNAAYITPLTAGPTADPSALPAITGTRYATTALDIRNTAADAYTAVAEVPKGTALSITGVLENGRMQIIYQNAVRWVTNAYLSVNPVIVTGGDSVGLAGLVPNATLLVADCRVRFPAIVTYYGVRPDASTSDHPTGHAVDLMLPNYRSNAALGQAMADYYRAHASQFGISYVIYSSHIWSVARSSEGWRFMADRGSDTQNHKDHVHVSFH